MAIKPKIGLLGGSFDPVHKAHIALAQAAIDNLGLDQLQLLPAYQPWQKSELNTSAQQRLEMLRLSIQDQAKIIINTSEIERQGPTYTIDTVKALPKNVSYFWIMGSDQLANFCSWLEWQNIIKHVDLAVAVRPGTCLRTPAKLQQELGDKKIHEIPFTPIDISSTAIRQAINKPSGFDNLATMLDSNIINYIQKNKLYNYS